MSNMKPKFLNRFTTIPFLIDLLKRKQLTLLNPDLWEDDNDKATIELYRKKKNKTSIYALCLTDDTETIHHWNTFASGTSGCCIEFHYDKLIDQISKNDAVTYGKIKYVKIKDLKTLKIKTEKLPYLKRYPFRPEKEFRIIMLSNEEQKESFDIPISLDSIKRITITNKLPESVFKSVKQDIIKISSELKEKINHSTLFDNPTWKKYFDSQNLS